MTSSSSNPFRMPRNLTKFRIQEEEEKRQERRRQHTLKVHEKGLKPRESRRAIVSRYLQEIEQEEQKEEEERIWGGEAYIAPPKTHKPLEWDYYHMGTVRDFIETEQEISRLKYSIAVGRETIQGLKGQVPLHEEEMAKAEHRFSEEAFAKYVKEEEKKTMLALKMAEEESKAILETREKIQRTNNEIVKVKKEIVRYQEMLNYDQKCREFLWKLSPPQWQKQQEARKQIAEKIKAAAEEKEPATQANLRRSSGCSPGLPAIQNSHSTFFSMESCKPSEKMPQEDEGIVGNLEVYEKPQIYFTDPKQLLNIMAEMEEETNHLWTKLLALKKPLRCLCTCREKEAARVSKEIDYLTNCINANKAKAAEIQEKVKLFNMSEDSVERKNAVLKQLHQKIKEVYSVCMGCSQDTATSCQLLGTIEMYLYDLLEKFDRLPAEELKTIMKEYRREKLARAKKEEELLKELAQQERWRQRAEVMRQRALAEVKKPMVKKVMWRSWLEKKVPREQEKADLAKKEKDLESYFFEE
ncbi:cilia- and flagella-associated protein 100 [Pangasianodon hypophthalmus]|uniref:cilia- and flagella-associated protein 100 n=1 Tax=Pangasianodon hypophthalmus TaxID=310915 RepID=UPI0023070C18|nr:cilia- and flagella-associated protein 100 [Pangasianodon hypophthalmus]